MSELDAICKEAGSGNLVGLWPLTNLSAIDESPELRRRVCGLSMADLHTLVRICQGTGGGGVEAQLAEMCHVKHTDIGADEGDCPGHDEPTCRENRECRWMQPSSDPYDEFFETPGSCVAVEGEAISKRNFVKGQRPSARGGLRMARGGLGMARTAVLLAAATVLPLANAPSVVARPDYNALAGGMSGVSRLALDRRRDQALLQRGQGGNVAEDEQEGRRGTDFDNSFKGMEAFVPSAPEGLRPGRGPKSQSVVRYDGTDAVKGDTTRASLMRGLRRLLSGVPNRR